MLNWANRFNIFCFLDNNGYGSANASFEWILAVGCKRSVHLTPVDGLATLKDFSAASSSWLFGHLGYDLKNAIEDLPLSSSDPTGFGAGFFFEPETIIQLRGQTLSITGNAHSQQDIYSAIKNTQPVCTAVPEQSIRIQSFMDRNTYIEKVQAIQQHILRGDCYELNFCQHFFAHDVIIDPLHVYNELTKASPMPFGALYKLDGNYCLCASPERYLRKEGNAIISQPMKGTSKRDHKNVHLDQLSKDHLTKSNKEKSENVMVVDLVRNDLSRVCKEGSVVVEDLFSVQSFPQVHQMISTVKAVLKEDLHWTDAIRATFPMGSMTGAPKKKVMELINEYEPVGRGLFSGAIGYITPGDDFDFNVVIRSIFYNDAKHELSFYAGGGITFYSKPEEEYEESMLKTTAIRSVLGK